MTSIVNCNVMDEHILLCIDSLVVVDCCQLLSRCVCCLFEGRESWVFCTLGDTLGLIYVHLKWRINLFFCLKGEYYGKYYVHLYNTIDHHASHLCLIFLPLPLLFSTLSTHCSLSRNLVSTTSVRCLTTTMDGRGL
jgi:hypothetical protein